MKVFKITLILIILFVVLCLINLSVWLYYLDQDIQKKIQVKKFALPVQFFASPTKFFAGQKIPLKEIISEFQKQNYRKREKNQTILSGDYAVLNQQECLLRLSSQVEGLRSCIIFKKKAAQNSPIYTILYGSILLNQLQSDILNITVKKTADRILQIYKADIPYRDHIELEPQIFAQYYGQQPILRKVVPLSDIPMHCLNSVLSIEDANFLDHQGISFIGILRAFVKNIMAGKILQGGSTITQQFVKNYFLTHEKTFKRKLTEIAMAFLLELRVKKDDILEMYLNIVYMGQLGSFEIRGYHTASRYYFGKDIQNLDLHECALLAAIINSPGRYNPFTHKKEAQERRSIVLKKLLEFNYISSSEFKEADQEPLPEKPHIRPNRSVSFFIEAAKQQIKNLNLKIEEGLNIFTTLDLKAQTIAQDSIQKNLNSIEQTRRLKKTNKKLEAVLVAADPQTGFVQAVVGGRDFRKSQFNRAYQSKRPIGSIVKPIVYLTALTRKGSLSFTPLTVLEDKKFTITYPGGKWSPKNYQNRYFKSIPMYYALMRSLNAATANLGVQLGLDHITQMANRLGIASVLKPLPSLTLGTWELSALEVLQVYCTLATLGKYSELTFLTKIENAQGELIYKYSPEFKQVVDAKFVAQLVDMMKQVVVNGTAKGALRRGLYFPVAGKTGTTNDTKDSWFAGFSPFHTAVVWVGYDDNTSSGLTGASGALPIWTEYMLKFASQYSPEDFPHVKGLEKKHISIEMQKSLGIPQDSLIPFLELTLLESINIDSK